MRLTASRMVAKSTIAGTPVKSCRRTRAGLPLGQRADIFLMDKPAVLLPQQVLQKDFQGKRQPRYISDALFFERFQAVNFKTLRADFERVACVEGISSRLRHAQYPFSAFRSLLS